MDGRRGERAQRGDRERRRWGLRGRRGQSEKEKVESSRVEGIGEGVRSKEEMGREMGGK